MPDALQTSGLLPKEAQWTSVILTSNASPDGILAVAASFDETLRHGAQTPFSDQLSQRWEGGMWEYDSYHSSIITAGNGGTKLTKAAFTIFFNEGTEKYELEQSLQPDEQMWIDVGKLIREHVPDKNGKMLPADLGMGSYEFRDLTNKGVGTLFEGKIIYDKTYGHVTYGCGACCGYNNVVTTYDPLGIALGFTADNGVRARYVCTSTLEDVSADFYNWSTVNTAIATTTLSATHTGVSIGSTTSNTQGYLESNNRIQQCPLTTFYPSSGVKVGNPAQLVVIGDTTTTPTNCPNTKLRILAYQIQDSNGNDIKTNVQTKEQFSSKSTNTCNNAITTSETCSDTPNGVIHDSLSVGCNSVDNGCGYTYTNQQWVWCNGTVSTVIGTVGDLVVHDNAISVGGSYTSIKGKIIKP